MTERLEKQFVVSRRFHGSADQFIPWKWFDARASARAFAKGKVAKSSKWEYAVDPVTRGPRA